MGRYKQSRFHHEHEFLATLPMMLAHYWEQSHTREIRAAIEDINPDLLLYWTEGSLALSQVAEYLVHNKLTAMQDILQELDNSGLGMDLKSRIEDIVPRGSGPGQGEQRALKHKLPTCDWCSRIAEELGDMIAEHISTNKILSGRIAGFRKQANNVKAVIGVHES